MALRNEKRIMIEIESQTCTLQKHFEPLTRLLVHYKRDGVEGFQERVSLALHEADVMFRPAHDSFIHCAWKNHAMSRPVFHNGYDTVLKDALKDNNHDVCWIDDSDDTPPSHVGFVSIFPDKTTMSLKSTNLVAYPLHAIIRNCSATYWRWIIEDGSLFYASYKQTQFKGTVEGDLGLEYITISTKYWFTG